MPRKIDVRTVNAFLRKRGIDPAEFGAVRNNSKKLTRKEKARIEEIASSGDRALVYIKGDKFVIRSADRTFPFNDPAIAKRASLRGLTAQGKKVNGAQPAEQEIQPAPVAH